MFHLSLPEIDSIHSSLAIRGGGLLQDGVEFTVHQGDTGIARLGVHPMADPGL